MLEKLDKIAPYLLVAILGYLGYSSMESKGPKVAQGKDIPPITKEMLHPPLIAAQARVSPVDRDPFDVEWATYRAAVVPERVERAEANSRASSQPASQPASAPAVHPAPATSLPPMPGPVGGIFLGDDVCIAVIGDKLYKPGDLVGGADPSRCWLLETVQRDHIVLRFGEATVELHMPAGTDSSVRPGAVPRGEPKP